jgi:hypothetical protein
MSSIATCILAVFLGASNFFGAPRFAAAEVRQDSLEARHLEGVRIEAQSIGSLLSDLSLSHNIPIGLETAQYDDGLGSYEIDFKGGTLADLLTQFVAQHGQYAWEIKDGVVNVLPKESYRDALFKDLLKTRISNFSVKEKTSCQTLADALVATPEASQLLQAKDTSYRAPSFNGFYIPQIGRHFTLVASNLSLKSILNRVIEESPTARFWVIARNPSDQTFFISLAAQFEDSPLGTRKLGLSER